MYTRTILSKGNNRSSCGSNELSPSAKKAFTVGKFKLSIPPFIFHLLFSEDNKLTFYIALKTSALFEAPDKHIRRQKKSIINNVVAHGIDQRKQ